MTRLSMAGAFWGGKGPFGTAASVFEGGGRPLGSRGVGGDISILSHPRPPGSTLDTATETDDQLCVVGGDTFGDTFFHGRELVMSGTEIDCIVSLGPAISLFEEKPELLPFGTLPRITTSA
jgi:hypothetical protein